MPYGWAAVACIVAFIYGLWFATTADETTQKKRAATGIIFIDNVPYSVRPINRGASE